MKIEIYDRKTKEVVDAIDVRYESDLPRVLAGLHNQMNVAEYGTRIVMEDDNDE